jgi:hypothetical protein
MAERRGMSSNEKPAPTFFEQAALSLQALRGERLRSDILLRIDNTAEATSAPYQFDAAAGRLHRRGCRAIPDGAPLYGRWHLSHRDLTLACKRCKPLPDDTNPTPPTDRADLLLGVLALVSQFSGVLKERGRDYQKTDEGQALTAQLGAMYRNLGQREKEVVDTMLATLDSLIEWLRALDCSIKKNGADRKE